MVKLLFGKAGSGKSYVGRMVSLAYGFHFHDADEDLPERFRKAIEKREKATEEMREEYAQAIIATVRRLMASHGDVCICQALPRNRIRERILEAIPSMEYVWVDAPGDLVSARLSERSGHIASAGYAESVNRIFEAPTVPHAKLMNGNDPAELRRQMKAIFGGKSNTPPLYPDQTLHG